MDELIRPRAKDAMTAPGGKSPSGKRRRRLWVAGALVLASVLLFTRPGEVLWVGLYPVLVWFNVDHWFRWTEDVTLSDLSGSGVAEAGSVARAKETAKLSFAMRRGVDIDWGWKLLDPGTGTVVRVRVWTWHPLRSVSLARTIRDFYETHAADPAARIAADFATWDQYGIDDGYRLPPAVDFPPAAPGVPWEPVFDENAQLVLRAGTNAVPHLIEIATRTNPGWHNPLEAHVLLCKILDVRSRGADGEWCGIRAADWFAKRRDTPDVRAVWTPFRDTGILPADADGFFALPRGPATMTAFPRPAMPPASRTGGATGSPRRFASWGAPPSPVPAVPGKRGRAPNFQWQNVLSVTTNDNRKPVEVGCRKGSAK